MSKSFSLLLLLLLFLLLLFKINRVIVIPHRHLARGSANRRVGATDMNAQSSRSHAIFSVTMIQQKFVSSSTTPTSSRPGTPSKMLEPKIRSQSSVNNLRVSRRIDEGEFVTLTSKFHFVDLAGSERVSTLF